MRQVSDVNVGVWLFPDGPAAELVEAVVRAEEGGIDEIWIADEGVAREPIPLLSVAASRTRQIKLGVGITTPALRHPGAVGSTMSTLDELSDGRAILGFGVGGVASLGPFGLTVDKPIALIRDAVRTARAVIRREMIDGYEPPVHAAPARDVPIFIGARGEQMNRLASREADGVFLSGFDLGALDTPIEWARSVRPIEIALYASARFRADAPDDPTCLRGAPEEVAAGMHRLVERHRPDTIGLALVDGGDVLTMMDRAIEAVHRFRA